MYIIHLRVYTSITICGRPLLRLQFADDIDLIGGSKTELHNLTNRLPASVSDCGMEVSTEKSTDIVNDTNTTSVTTNIITDGEPLEEVYLGATLLKDGTCRVKICIRIATVTTAMARLNRVW